MICATNEHREDRRARPSVSCKQCQQYATRLFAIEQVYVDLMKRLIPLHPPGFYAMLDDIIGATESALNADRPDADALRYLLGVVESLRRPN